MKDKIGTILLIILLIVNPIVMVPLGVAILNALNQPVRVVEVTPSAPLGLVDTGDNRVEPTAISANTEFVADYWEHATPIPDGLIFDPGEIWIEVDIGNQILYVWETYRLIAGFRISSGAPGKDTPTGLFKIYAMYDSYPTWGPDYHYVVPWAMWFHHEFGIHGADWHDDFGTPVSHGCVNMNVNDAQWVYGQVVRGTYVWVHE